MRLPRCKAVWHTGTSITLTNSFGTHSETAPHTVGAIEGGGLVFRPGKIQFSRFFHKNLYLDSLGCPRMMYKIWLKNFENFDNFENFEKGQFFH